MTWGTQEISNIFSESNAILPFVVENKKNNFEDGELVQVSEEEENSKKAN